ncbi:hypothetical protein [Algivirga pacifica]
MTTRIHSILLLLLLLFTGCNNSESTTTHHSQIDKPITDITYQEIIQRVLTGEGSLVNYRGEATSTEAKASISLTIDKEGGNCSDLPCGQCVYLSNRSNTPVRVLVRSPFEIGPWHTDAISLFELGPREKALVGNSHFCHGKIAYPVEHYIIGAEYM